MDIFTGIIAYLLIWWTVLFAVLPIGARAPEQQELGHMTGAPADPQLKKKAIMTTAIAAGIWVVVFILIQIGVIDFFEIARSMSEEDIQP